MKQEALAKIAGVRRETLGNLEKGRYRSNSAFDSCRIGGYPSKYGFAAPGYPQSALHTLH